MGKINKLTPLEALCYLDDIAHGRIMKYDPHELKIFIEKSLKALEIIKKCFEVNGFDELIPNSQWWKLPFEVRSALLKELTK